MLEEAADGALAKFAKFDILSSRCYDPNEEAVLKRIIKTVGSSYFNERIHKLAEGCGRSNLDQSFKGSFRAWISTCQ